MDKYFFELQFNGSSFSGWQTQLNVPTVQKTIENCLTQLLNKEISLVGCGRTDTGVHAHQFFAHLELPKNIPANLVYRLNKMLPKSIVITNLWKVDQNAHARFDAIEREYKYTISTKKDPFSPNMSFYYPLIDKIELSSLNKVASMITQYDAFFPFCKAHSDVTHYKCDVILSKWEYSEKNGQYIYRIIANRFLRGMVRLLVGMQLNVGLEKITMQSVQDSLEDQTRLERDWSVEAKGLSLVRVKYPEGIFIKEK